MIASPCAWSKCARFRYRSRAAVWDALFLGGQGSEVFGGLPPGGLLLPPAHEARHLGGGVSALGAPAGSTARRVFFKWLLNYI